MFPLSFSGTRWLEDQQVAERLIGIWSNLEAFVIKVNEKPVSKRPKCASYGILQRAISTENLTLAKLMFFTKFAKMMRPFLLKFQTTAPMSPFVDYELTKLLKSLMQEFVKASKLGTSPTVQEMLAIDLDDPNNVVLCTKVGVGIATKEQLNKLELSEAKLREFMFQCLSCYKAIVMKIKERMSQETVMLVGYLGSINPKYIYDHPNQTVLRFEKLIIYLIQHRIVASGEGDAILQQYKDLVTKVRSEKRKESSKFSPSDTSRVDNFFTELIGSDPEFKGLCYHDSYLTLV